MTVKLLHLCLSTYLNNFPEIPYECVKLFDDIMNDILITKYTNRFNILLQLKINNKIPIFDINFVKKYNNDKEILLEFFKDNVKCELIQYISPTLQLDMDIILTLLIRGTNLEYFLPEIKDNNKVVRIAVNKDGMALQFASSRLKDTFFIVSLAINNNGMALIFASERLQHHIDICTQAVKQKKKLIKQTIFANNFEAVLASVTAYGLLLKFASYELQNSEHIVSTAVSNDGLALQYASKNLRDNYDIVKHAVKNNGNALQFASDRLRDDIIIVRHAVENTKTAYQYVSPRLQQHRFIVLTLVYYHENSIEYINNDELVNMANEFISFNLQYNISFYTNYYRFMLSYRARQKYASIKTFIKDNIPVV